MSTARHHAEWLSLVEASGPFVSLPVLLQAFPQGLEAHDPDAMRRLKLAHEEWDDNQQGTRPDPAIHRAWVEFVLTETLELPEEVLLSGQSISAGLQVTVAEQGETLRPDWVVINPDEGHKPRLLIQIYPASQSLEKSVKGSRWAASPATRMMELLHACDVRLGLITNGDHWMLVNAPKGETTGYISWYAALWQEENVTLRAFRSLLGVERFFNVPDDETLEALLTKSVNSQQEVTDQLGYQVRKAVEVLVQSIDRIDQDRNRDLLRGTTETRLYEAALTVMMRLVFLFFAEENQLIPPQETEFYDTFYAVTTLREQLREQADQNGEEILERKHDAWCRLLATFRAVHGGVHHDALYIPAYGGSLFNPDRFPFLEGRKADTHWLEVAADPIPVNNRTVLHLLEALQVLQVRVPGGGVESRKLSFRALDIEQIGHVYEGLLDHTAVRATEPILGLEGSKNKEPEVSLTALEQQWQKGEAALVEFLSKQTGRSPAALKKRIPSPPHPSPLPGEEGTGSDLPSPPGRGAGGEGFTQGNKLLIACNNDQALCHRVLRWVGLIRLDTFDYPTVIPAGSVFVTQGSDRRETGTHYTPKTLTEEIVKYTLEPLVYAGVAEGKPKEEWRLKSASELLALKVCDMAMGSGAFLVQVCRYLSERLVEAWEMEIDPHPSPLPQERELEMEKLAGHLRQVPAVLLERAKELRQTQTPAEEILWECLRDRRLHNAKFRRQHNIDRFIADFYCHQARLVIELDGEVHNTSQERDALRDDWMIQHGFRVLRFTNDQVFEDLEGVLVSIAQALDPHPQSPHPLTSSPWGEGEQEAVLTPLSRGRGAGGEGSGGEGLRILPDGSLSTAEPGEAILPNDPDERLAIARRIVADRCLYGVDKNPMAVEMAKLSLWLITLQKNRPFTFLDHALRCGDSLLGVTRREQIEFLHLNPDNEAVQLRTVSEIWRPLLAQAIAKRQELESFTVNDIQDLARKEALQAEAEALTSNIKIAADYLIGEALAQAGKTGNLKVEDLGVLSGLVTDALEEPDEQRRENKLRQIREKAQRMLNAGKPEGQPPREPFHWALEFPEVFLKEDAPEGFSAIVGNPPFLAGRHISSTLGQDYLKFLQDYSGIRGQADLCSAFSVSAMPLTKENASAGWILTKTIAEGDTRDAFLKPLVDRQMLTLTFVRSPIFWPGDAQVIVSLIVVSKKGSKGKVLLNYEETDYIDSTLGSSLNHKSRIEDLVLSKDLVFKGVGLGSEKFVIESNEKLNPHLEKDRVKRYITGVNHNTYRDGWGGKRVFYFQDIEEIDELKRLKSGQSFTEQLEEDDNAKGKFWLYRRSGAALYKKLSESSYCIIRAQTSSTWSFSLWPKEDVFDQSIIVFCCNCKGLSSVLNSSIHEVWAVKFGRFIRTDFAYAPSNSFYSFPLPYNPINGEAVELSKFAVSLQEVRQSISEDRQEGLTKIYSSFHDPTRTDPDIQTLRHLHIQMDTAVAAAYGWHDLPLNHDFHDTKQGLRFTIIEEARREVLDRLLALNHRRYAEEVAQGLHDKKKAKGKSKKAKSKPTSVADPSGKYTTQGNLFGDDPATQGELF